MVKYLRVSNHPRYFDKLVEKFELSEIDLEKIKKFRQDNSEAAQMSFDKLSNCSYLEYIESLEEKKLKQISSLKRCI